MAGSNHALLLFLCLRYGDNVEVDYRGNDVNVENFLRVLTGTTCNTEHIDTTFDTTPHPTTRLVMAGRHTAGMPRSKQLNTDEGSNILVHQSTRHHCQHYLNPTPCRYT